MRAFIAIDLPPTVHRDLHHLQSQLAAADADVRWVATDQLHPTLKFLGNITDVQRQETEALLARVAAQHPPFTLGLTRLGAFPGLHRPRVMWVGLGEGGDAVTRLARSIEDAAVTAGLVPAERLFTGHVTLGRMRSSRGMGALAERLTESAWTPPDPWDVRWVVLYESVLRRGGAEHTMLADAELGSG